MDKSYNMSMLHCTLSGVDSLYSNEDDLWEEEDWDDDEWEDDDDLLRSILNATYLTQVDQ
jgi:hypothetical protein